jgi:hypothetical protein
MASYATLKSNVRDKLRTDPNAKIVSADLIGLFLNDAQREIEAQGDWPFAQVKRTFSTVSDQQEYTLSSEIREPYQVEHSDRDVPLSVITQEQAIRLGTSSGTPYYFYMRGKSKMGFYHVPDDSSSLVTYWAYRYFPDMSRSTSSIIPSEYHYLLETYALGQCYKTLNQTERGNDKLAEFYNGINKLKENYMIRVPGGDYRVNNPEDFDIAPENTFNYFV